MVNKKTKGYTKNKLDIFSIYMEKPSPVNETIEYVKDCGLWTKHCDDPINCKVCSSWK